VRVGGIRNKSAAGTDVEANLPPRRGNTHELLSRVGCADIQICFYDVVSLEAYSVYKICSSGMAAFTCRRKIFRELLRDKPSSWRVEGHRFAVRQC